jgi:hypothetical protein
VIWYRRKYCEKKEQCREAWSVEVKAALLLLFIRDRTGYTEMTCEQDLKEVKEQTTAAVWRVLTPGRGALEVKASSRRPSGVSDE